jgi:hypothetical protein
MFEDAGIADDVLNLFSGSHQSIVADSNFSGAHSSRPVPSNLSIAQMLEKVLIGIVAQFLSV